MEVELMKELTSFLKSKSDDMRYEVSKQILGLLANERGLRLIGDCEECWGQLIQLACNDQQQFIRKSGLQCLTNLSSEEDLAEKLANYDNCLLVKSCLQSIHQQTSTAEASTMVLSNLTRASPIIQLVWNFIKNQNETQLTIEKVVDLVCDNRQENEVDWDHLAQVLCNLSQLSCVRKELTKEPAGQIKQLVRCIKECKSPLRRKGMVGVIRNCCFDTECHQWLLSDDVDIIPVLVYPLAGPEELDEDENDKLPIELQYLEASKERDSDPEVRKMLLEALLQLCATKNGRKLMKDKGIYYLMRELHKWEEVKSVLVSCENLVDILIGDEPKSDMENLKSVEIPADLQDKFKRMDEEDNL